MALSYSALSHFFLSQTLTRKRITERYISANASSVTFSIDADWLSSRNPCSIWQYRTTFVHGVSNIDDNLMGRYKAPNCRSAAHRETKMRFVVACNEGVHPITKITNALEMTSRSWSQ